MKVQGAQAVANPAQSFGETTCRHLTYSFLTRPIPCSQGWLFFFKVLTPNVREVEGPAPFFGGYKTTVLYSDANRRSGTRGFLLSRPARQHRQSIVEQRALADRGGKRGLGLVPTQATG